MAKLKVPADRCKFAAEAVAPLNVLPCFLPQILSQTLSKLTKLIKSFDNKTIKAADHEMTTGPTNGFHLSQCPIYKTG